MSRKGDCWDKTWMNRFMNSYMSERARRPRHASVKEVHHRTSAHIEIFYNRQHYHQALGYLSPAGFGPKTAPNDLARPLSNR